MYYGMETGITWGWIFPLICLGFMVLCMAKMIGGFLRGSQMGWCRIHHHIRTRRNPHVRTSNQRGSSIIPTSGPDRNRLMAQRQSPDS